MGILLQIDRGSIVHPSSDGQKGDLPQGAQHLQLCLRHGQGTVTAAAAAAISAISTGTHKKHLHFQQIISADIQNVKL
jgi:hypothetical protein